MYRYAKVLWLLLAGALIASVCSTCTADDVRYTNSLGKAYSAAEKISYAAEISKGRNADGVGINRVFDQADLLFKNIAPAIGYRISSPTSGIASNSRKYRGDANTWTRLETAAGEMKKAISRNDRSKMTSIGKDMKGLLEGLGNSLRVVGEDYSFPPVKMPKSQIGKFPSDIMKYYNAWNNDGSDLSWISSWRPYSHGGLRGGRFHSSP